MNDYIRIPVPADIPELAEGTRAVIRGSGRSAGRTAIVVGWAAGKDAWQKAHETGDLEYLAGEEGPLIRFEDQDPGDETVTWWPGQAMGIMLDAISA